MTVTTAIATPDRIRRCRMRDRLGNPCPNPTLSDDEMAIAICGKHAAKVMELVREKLNRRTS